MSCGLDHFFYYKLALVGEGAGFYMKRPINAQLFSQNVPHAVPLADHQMALFYNKTQPERVQDIFSLMQYLQL